MKYVKVHWLHDSRDDPITYYSELADDRYETRKVQIYRDGRAEWSDEEHETAAVGLSEVPFPDLMEISSRPEFIAEEIDSAEFESVWNMAREGKQER